MPSSQLVFYSSSDASAPVLDGQAGSLLNVLDGVLVNGYGSQTAAGWSKPIANSGNVGCYKMGGGSLMSLHINDNGPNGTSTTKEAWATGWESISAITAPVGVGSGQFPLPAQCLTTGHTVIRKSTATGATQRPWMIFADDRTFYLFVGTGDTAGRYYSFMFGDFFALATQDVYNCAITARDSENASSYTHGDFDLAQQLGTTVVTAGFAPRPWGGRGTSTILHKMADWGKYGAATNTNGSMNLTGVGQTPNGPDGSYYLHPVYVCEQADKVIRGRYRGLYQICHPITNFSDGQVFYGSNDYAGKTFQVVKTGPNGAGMIAVETSATVETN